MGVHVSHGEPLVPVLGVHLLVILVLGCVAQFCIRRRQRQLAAAKGATAAEPAEPAAAAAAPAAEYPIIFVGTGTAIISFEYNDDGRLARLGPPVPVGGSPTWVVPDKTSTRLFCVDVRNHL